VCACARVCVCACLRVFIFYDGMDTVHYIVYEI